MLAIEIEISEIDEQIYRLRHKRSQLVERQDKLKNTLQQNQRTTFNTNLIEQWQRTGSIKLNLIFKFIIHFIH